jgi:hypothetical protein
VCMAGGSIPILSLWLWAWQEKDTKMLCSGRSNTRHGIIPDIRDEFIPPQCLI